MSKPTISRLEKLINEIGVTTRKKGIFGRYRIRSEFDILRDIENVWDKLEDSKKHELLDLWLGEGVVRFKNLGMK